MNATLAWLAGVAGLMAAVLAGYGYGDRRARRAGSVPAGAGVHWAALAAAVVAAGAVAALVGGWTGGRQPAGETSKTSALPAGGSPATAGPVVPVVTAPLRESTITETVTAYGAVVSRSGEMEVVSVPYEARVEGVRVTSGQRVSAGAALLDVVPSAGTALRLQQAKAAVDAAARRLKETEERYRANLTTNQELITAQADLETTRAALASLEEAGAAGRRRLTAEVSGIISKLDVRVGQTLPAGTPLVEVAPGRNIEVLLGVEPKDLAYLRVGQPVRITPVHDDAGTLEGRVRLLTRRVNPATRLVDVFVAVPQEANLLLGSYVRGTLTTRSKRALVAPRQAALPGEGGYVLFTVVDGRAVKHVVSLGLTTDHAVEIVGSGLATGDPVIVVGNYALEDGTAVQQERTSPAREAPPASPAPGTAP